MKKSDVKSHLSTGSGTSVYPFGLIRPEAADGTEGKDATAISISPSHPIAPEATPNAQVGGSVGMPESSGKPRW